MENKTRRKRISFVFVIFLVANISNMLRSETLKTIRVVDALQLIACGMLIGALIVNLVMTGKSEKE